MFRILIVDRNDSTRAIMRDRLKDTYEILETNNAEKALVMALERKPDALLFDMSVFEKSFFPLQQTLNSLNFPQGIPVFACGNGSTMGSTSKTVDQNPGAIEYFEKPVDFEKLKVDLGIVLNTKKPERRREVRVQLNTTLRLRGTDKHGATFEQATVTENVSSNGFLCVCTALLEKNTLVEVFLGKTGNHRVGTARTMRTELKDSKSPRYGFRFEAKENQWILS